MSNNVDHAAYVLIQYKQLIHCIRATDTIQLFGRGVFIARNNKMSAASHSLFSDMICGMSPLRSLL